MSSDSGYGIFQHGAMVLDAVRMDAYARAITASVAPGSVVVDLGTGTGIMAMLACRAGARRVYAIERDEVIQLARDVASANGFAERIVFMQGNSFDLRLPEAADVLVADAGGALPWFRDHLKAIADARRRFLTANGVVIPQRDSGWAAVAERSEQYSHISDPWQTATLGFKMESPRQAAMNTIASTRVSADDLLSDVQCWGAIDYSVADGPDVHARLEWTVTRAGVGHGVAAGFTRTLADGITFSNAPDAAASTRSSVYSQVLFPWERPVPLVPGDRVVCALEGHLVGQSYIWNWATDICSVATHQQKAAFKQSTFFGIPMSPTRLRTRGAAFTPALNERGRIARQVLGDVSHGRTLKVIAEGLVREFPHRFADAQQALNHAVELLQDYGGSD
ncbi:MAG TPA: 50S ribosomal protein L11 methyltransferase [Vicinamibacterales bacterium]|jgi:protein arginine N-methyltransferase 1|nr:50S ribosomal protein L11 methyltransferase [Vicinamibacterales bacterium]